MGDAWPLDSRLGGFTLRCSASVFAFSMRSLFARGPLITDAGGRRALASVPKGVELGCMLGGSETDLSDGTLFGISLGFVIIGGSRGVLASEESSEPGDPGLAKSSLPIISSGVSGTELGVQTFIV
jgi:hypothetical protein